MTELRARACRAFDADFRDKLADAAQVKFYTVGALFPYRCPLGCLTRSVRPTPAMMHYMFPMFSYFQFLSFVSSFDLGADNTTAEAALGLLYRRKFAS